MERTVLTDSQIDGWWDVARVGRWTGSLGGRAAEVEITPQDLQEIVADYSDGVQEAPLTVEHRREGPALGWVKDLRLAGDRLQARFKDISGQLREWLAEGAYRSRSIELYKPFSHTGRAYLGAVSFLGAAAPAVKGLSPEPSLLADAPGDEKETGTLRVESGVMHLAEAPEEGTKEAEKKAPGRLAGTLREMLSGRSAREGRNAGGPEECLSLAGRELAELRQALATEREARRLAEEKSAALAAELDSRRREAELGGFRRTLETAAAEARLTPAELSGYLKLGERLDETGRAAILEEVAARRPSAIFRELSAPEEKRVATEEDLRLRRGLFEGFPEDPEHDAALRLMASDTGLSFVEALARVRRQAAAAV
jgi:hypothetical protein